MSDTNDKQTEKDAPGDKKGPSGGNSGAGRSGKEDMGSEKPTTSPEFGSRKPGTT